MKITRDAELYIDDEFKGNLLEKIRKSLVKRNIGPASRFVYDRSMPLNMLEYFVNLFGIEPDDMIQEVRPEDVLPFFQLPAGEDALSVAIPLTLPSSREPNTQPVSSATYRQQ